MNENRFQAGWKVSLYTLAANVILALIKAAAGILANSSALLADAVHSASDAASTVGVLIGFRIASKPADTGHPYGHGRAESITAKILALVLIMMGVAALVSAVQKGITQAPHRPGEVALWAAALSIITKEVMYRCTLRVGQKTQSPAIIADAWHHRSDALSSVAALIGVFGSRMGLSMLDPIAGIAVAVVVIKVGVDILRTSIAELMDSQPPDEVTDNIRAAAANVNGVEEIGTLSVRTYGPHKYIDMSIGVEGSLSVCDGHLIAERVRQTILGRFEEVSDVLVHVDPCTPTD